MEGQHEKSNLIYDGIDILMTENYDKNMSLYEHISRFNEERSKETGELEQSLKSIVVQYPLHEFLALIAAFSWPKNKARKILVDRIGRDEKIGIIYSIYLPALAKYAIVNSTDENGTSNLPFEKAFSDIFRCLLIINEIKDRLPSGHHNNPEEIFSAYTFGLANQHYLFQEALEILKNMVSRSLIIFRDIPQSRKSSIDIIKAFQDIYGITLQKFWRIALKLMFTYDGSWLSLSNIVDLEQSPCGFTREDIEIFFEKLSLSYNEFRERAQDTQKSFTEISTQFYGYSPFDSHPILKRENQYLIISTHYYTWRLFLPIYFDLLEFYQQSDDLGDNPFSEEFGHIFQEYVGQQLQQLNDGGELLPEFKYGRDNRDFTDWTIIYDDSAILIEVKKNVLPLKARFGTDDDWLKKSLQNTFIKGFQQINTKIGHVRENHAGLEIFREIRHFFPIVITFDNSYRLNGPYIRKIINKELLTDCIEFEHNWQILTMRELEDTVSICNQQNTLLNLFQKKISTIENTHREWDNFLRALGFRYKKMHCCMKQ